MTKVRTRRNQPGFAQLSCWIGDATMKRLVAFVDAKQTKQRVVVDAAIAKYLDAAELEEPAPASPPATAEASNGQ